MFASAMRSQLQTASDPDFEISAVHLMHHQSDRSVGLRMSDDLGRRAGIFLTQILQARLCAAQKHARQAS